MGGLAIATVSGAIIGICVRLIGIPRRWSLWYSSPNDLGCISALTVLIATGLLSSTIAHYQRCQLTGRSTLLPIVIISSISLLLSLTIGVLVGSCSRAGFLALGMGLLTFAMLTKGHQRLLAMVLLLTFAIAIAIVPRAGGRVMINPTEDGSIACRVQLAQSAAAMMADRPTGWGSGQFGNICEQWYLPKFRGIHLWEPLNDALWFGTQYGLLALFCYYVVIFGSLFGFLSLARNQRHGPPGISTNSWPAIGVAVILAILIGGSCTTLLRPGGPFGSIVVSLIVVGIGVITITRTERAGWGRWMTRGFLLGGVFAGAVTMLWWVTGSTWANSMAWQPEIGTIVPTAGPRHQSSRGRVILIRPGEDSDNEICRQVARWIAAAGFQTVVVTRIHDIEGTSEPSVIIWLRGTSGISSNQTQDHMLTNVRGQVFVDADMPTNLGEMSCPVLLLHGTQVPIAQLAPVAGSSVTIIEAPVAICWPRNLSKSSSALCGWIDDRFATR